MGNLMDFYSSLDNDTEQAIIMNSKDQGKKNRYMVQNIDSIFKEEKQNNDENISRIKGEINKWAKNHEQPSNPETSFIKHKQFQEDQKKRK